MFVVVDRHWWIFLDVVVDISGLVMCLHSISTLGNTRMQWSILDLQLANHPVVGSLDYTPCSSHDLRYNCKRSSRFDVCSSIEGS